MMRRLLTVILLLIALMAFLTHIKFAGEDHLMSASMMALGFTLIAAYLIGKTVMRLQLPKITGYILAGILAGPYVTDLLSVPVVRNLQLIDNIALSLIALTAGGEFRYKTIKKQMKTIGSTILWQVIIVLLTFVIFIFLYQNHISFLAHKPLNVVLGVALIFGSLAIAKSPATTIAIITESRAKGKFTDFVLGVTVFKDIVVVLVFSIVISFAKPMILPETPLHFTYLFNVFLEIILSIIVGFAAGLLILFYLKYVGKQTVLFLLGFILLGIELSRMFHLEVILLFMVAGFFVQNFSNAGGKLISAIEGGSLPIFVIFFAIAGASLNFPVFLENWFLAVLIVGLRMLSTYEGTYIGARLTGGSREVQNYGWMGFIGQAGLTLGLAVLVKQNLPGIIGESIATLIIASIAINQIVGPVMFRYSLVKVGETGVNRRRSA
ncbi:MAG: cation:proton antiporter [Calditrichia bacterium]